MAGVRIARKVVQQSNSGESRVIGASHDIGVELQLQKLTSSSQALCGMRFEILRRLSGWFELAHSKRTPSLRIFQPSGVFIECLHSS